MTCEHEPNMKQSEAKSLDVGMGSLDNKDLWVTPIRDLPATSDSTRCPSLLKYILHNGIG